VDELVGNFQDCRFIVTSRPSAVEEGWLSNEGFDDAELQAMQLGDILSFIDHWHDAVREELEEGEEKTELPGLAEALKAEIRRSKQKRELATSPLLCAMLCALHRERRGQVPSDRVRLYEACIEMLVDRRDVERGIKLYDYPELGYRQKRALLEDLAYWMLKNNWPDVEWSQAEEWLGKKLQNLHGLPTNTTAANVLDLLVERSGIVREPVPEHIDFTHKTFQEFLAAQAAINEGDTGLLIENAHKDQWREVVILAAGVTKKERGREEIISGLIERGDRTAKDRYQLHLLAVACLENSLSLSPELKAQVEARLEKLLPPKNMTDAKALATAGELAFPFLAKYTDCKAGIAAACVRTLSLIGGEQALDILEEYARDYRITITDELAKGWQSSDLKAEYGRRILARIWNSRSELFLQRISSLDGLQFLTNLSSLDLSGCSQISDLSPLGHLTNLTSLDLSECSQVNDLSPLRDLINLTSLRLSRCSHLSDLSPLEHLTNLTSLDLNRCSQLNDMSSLTHLTNLTSLSLSRCTQVNDLSPLTHLTNLTSLNLGGCSHLSDLSMLAHLPKLKGLYAWGISKAISIPQAIIKRVHIYR
jgi:hypothetical protein